MKWYRHVLPPVCLYLWHIASTTQEWKKASGTKLYLGGRWGGGGGGGFLPEQATSNRSEHGIYVG